MADLVNISSVAGRRVGQGGGIYQLTKHGVGVFSEALRQEVTARHVRVSLVEPGATRPSCVAHVREGVRGDAQRVAASRPGGRRHRRRLVYIVTRPRHMAVNEILIRPTDRPADGQRLVRVAGVAGHVFTYPLRSGEGVGGGHVGELDLGGQQPFERRPRRRRPPRSGRRRAGRGSAS